MVVYFAVFCAIAIFLSWLIASFYEWRQDVLSGRYIEGDSERSAQWPPDAD
jgi:hypothetical protein